MSKDECIGKSHVHGVTWETATVRSTGKEGWKQSRYQCAVPCSNQNTGNNTVYLSWPLTSSSTFATNLKVCHLIFRRHPRAFYSTREKPSFSRFAESGKHKTLLFGHGPESQSWLKKEQARVTYCMAAK